MAGMLQVWNMALGWVGTRTVAAENENTQEAVQCRLFWDNARRQVLRDFPWNFARRRARLARRDGGAADTGFGARFCVSIPQSACRLPAPFPQGSQGVRDGHMMQRVRRLLRPGYSRRGQRFGALGAVVGGHVGGVFPRVGHHADVLREESAAFVEP